MKTTIAVALTVAFSTLSAFAETALEIASTFETQKIEAIEKYMAANPEAKDIDGALSILIGAHLTIGKMEPIPAFLEKRYELQPKGEKADVETVMNEILRPYIETATITNQRDKAKAFITRFKEDLNTHPQSAQINQYVDQMAGSLYLPGVGDKMELAFTDTKGKDVDMSKMKDKVVLVDFWATWCGPCIAEMPNVIAAYEKYHDKGFEVIGISLDETKQPLVEFTEGRGMTWPQYFDGKGWENEIAQRYGIKSIPATFLVGKDGKIIASNLRGTQLEEAVEKELAAE